MRNENELLRDNGKGVVMLQDKEDISEEEKTPDQVQKTKGRQAKKPTREKSILERLNPNTSSEEDDEEEEEERSEMIEVRRCHM